jgi:multidrug efflux pump subunit AcrA (membrane-fusion protein)
LVSSTINAAKVFAAGQVGAAGAVSAKVAALTEGVLKAMFLTKIKVATVGLLVVGSLATGVASSGLIYHTQTTEQAESRKEAQPKGHAEGNKEEQEAAAEPVQVEQVDERTVVRISTRVDGEIEKLATATGERVKKGETLAELSSRDVNVVVQELLAAKQSGNAEILGSLRDRLERWGVSKDEIDAVLKTGKVVQSVTIRSPVDGKIVRVYHIKGDHVKAGDPLFEVSVASTAKAEEARPTQRNAIDTKVQELLNERLATVKELAKATQAAYLQGKATIAEVTQANTLLVKAELELCKSDKERVAVHEKAVTLAKEYEKNAEQLFTTGRATQASVLAVRADRLEAEIAYERIKANTAIQRK